MLKKILLALAVIILLAQVVRPEKNLTNERTFDISTRYPLSESLNATLQGACNDCHSNKTNYPWYVEIQPVGWWLNYHVADGKKHLNFSDFTRLPIAVQNHKFEEIIETVKEGEMPMPSYTWLGLHQEARLTDQDKSAIVEWARLQMDSLKRQYPPDSLVMKRRTPPPSE